jgi:hypothetical protein
LALGSARFAAAAPPPETICKLQRAPLLLPISSTMPAQLQCASDQDGNGLDDEMELQLAKCFVPELRFDAAENATAWGSEPHVFFSAYRVRPSAVSADAACVDQTAPLIRLRFGLVWSYDGGFVADGGVGCGNDHAGDTQSLTVDVQILKGTSWYGVPVAFHGDPDPALLPNENPPRFLTCNNAQGFGPFELNGKGHPVIYPTAGKHHWRYSAGEYQYDVSGGGYCFDPARGNGPRVVPQVLHHLPIIYQGTRHLFWSGEEIATGMFPTSTTPLMADGRWANACAARRHGTLEPATRLHGVSLADLGFAVNLLDSSFLAPGTSGVWSTVQIDGAFVADADGDQLSEIDAEVSREESWVLGAAQPFATSFTPFVAQDPCPLHGPQSGVDEDLDGVDDTCDPDVRWWTPFVGGGSKQYGSNEWPAASEYLLGSWSSKPKAGFGPRGGFLDTDRDGVPDGEDACPFNYGGFGDTNTWGEDLNWPPGPGTIVGGGKNVFKGMLQRGDDCDPYAIGVPEWSDDEGHGEAAGSSSHGTLCYVNLTGSWCGGRDIEPIRQRVTVGVSNNDPLIATDAKPARNLWMQTHRCACRAPEGLDCLEHETGECFRRPATASDDYSAQGAGRYFRPIDRFRCNDDRDVHSFCQPYSILATHPLRTQAYDIQLSSTGWEWARELSRDESPIPPPGWIRHFALDDFTVNSVNQRVSTREYVIWAMTGMDRGADKYGAPGPLSRSHAPAERFYPDPEAIDTRLLPAAGPNASEESRRLRSGYETRRRGLVSFKCGTGDPIVDCRTFNLKYSLMFWESFIRWPDRPQSVRNRLLIGVQGDRIEQTFVFGLRDRIYSKVELAADALGSWVASSSGTIVPLGGGQRAAHEASPASAQSDTIPAVFPDILWVEKGTAQPRWARLRPVQTGDRTVWYDLSDQGSVGAPIGAAAILVGDQFGETAAILDVASDRVLGFDPTLRAWVANRASVASVGAREGAATLLLGSKLVVLGGRRGGQVLSDAWSLDVLGGEHQPIASGLPARHHALSSLSTDGQSIVLVGGADQQGATHDDVWTLALGGPEGLGRARLVRSDTADRGAWISAATVIESSSEADDIRAWSIVDREGKGGLLGRARTSQGWTPTGRSGLPQPDNCPLTDTTGGELCALSASWWASPGERACASAPEPGACRGAPGVAVAAAMVNPGRHAIDAVPDGRGVWVFEQGARLERWEATSSGVMTLAAAVALPAPARAIAADSGRVLAATDSEVREARLEGSGIVLSPPRKLCGQVMSAVPLGGGTSWAVATTFGLALVATGQGGVPEPRSMSLLVPGVGGDGRLLPFPVDPGSTATCDQVMSLLDPGLAHVVAGSAAMSLASSSRLLAARAGWLFDIDVSDTRAPRLRDGILTVAALRRLRVDERGERAYGVGTHGPHVRSPIIDLRGAQMVLRGQHELRDWVERRDGGQLSVRVRASGKLDVAWVAR